MKTTSQISLDITIPKGYIVTYKTEDTISLDAVKLVSKMIKRAEKNNILMSANLISSLISMETFEVKEIKEQFDEIYKPLKGQFFRSVFATGEDINDEEFTFNDLIEQFIHYTITYGLGEIDYGSFDEDKKRKIQESNISKRKDKQEINNTFKIIDTKTTDGFIKDVKTILESPIVFGEQQINFIEEAKRVGFLSSILNSIESFKVKENLFNLIKITGKDFVKENNVFKTPTDILRYCYFVSDLDYKRLPKLTVTREIETKENEYSTFPDLYEEMPILGEFKKPFSNKKRLIRKGEFSLKTSDKKLVMSALNIIAKKDLKETFGEMKPYKSQWIALSRNLFPGAKKFKKFPNAQIIFDSLRDKAKVETFNGITQRLIMEKDYFVLSSHLSKKPGEFLRNLDMIIRKIEHKDFNEVLLTLEKIKLNPKLVIQVKKWISYRKNKSFSERIFNIKGKPVSITNKPLEKLDEERANKVVKTLRNVLIKHLSGKELFGSLFEKK